MKEQADAPDSSGDKAVFVARMLSKNIKKDDLEEALTEHTYGEVAELLFSSAQIEKSREVARRAISFAAKTQLDPEQREHFAEKNKQRGRERAKITIAQRAALVIDATHERKSWSDDELKRLQELVADPTFHFSNIKGKKSKPNLDLIAKQLNNEFHRGEAVRDHDKCSDQLVYLKKKSLRGIEIRQPEWSDNERDRLRQLMNTLLHSPQSTNPGKPNFRDIATTLNQEFHEGETGRSIESCRQQYKYLLSKDTSSS